MVDRVIKALCAGFQCIDIIHDGTVTKTSLGGTAANIAAILSCLGQNVTFIGPEYYSDEWGRWLKSEIEERKIKLLLFTSSKKMAPRIIEYLNTSNGNHKFFTKCPVCGQQLINCILPNQKQINDEIISHAKEANVFFYDRISPGITQIATQHFSGWNCYEPNTFRNYKSLLQAAASADIIKFSQSKIQKNYLSRLISDLKESKVSIIISTMGSEGLSFSYRKESGELSDWQFIKAEQIDSITDSAGAVDWFSAVFLLLFLRQYPHYSKEIDINQIINFFEIAKQIAARKCRFLGVHEIFSEKTEVDIISKMLHVNTISYQINNVSLKTGCEMCGI